MYLGVVLSIMFSKLFGFKKKEEATEVIEPHGDFSFLGTDMHSHLVPGVDDGAQTMEDSITLIRRFQALGFSSIITTPHIKWDHYPNTTEIIQLGLKELQQGLQAAGIRMPIKAAAEYYLDDHFMELLNAKDLMPIHGNEVLIEFSFMAEPIQLSQTLFKVQTQGYKPIIAHPERYEYMHREPSAYNSLKDRGCYLQLNTLALTGYYGRGVKEAAEYMLANNLYDYCGTDTHHLRHTDGLDRLRSSRVMDQLRNYSFRNRDIKMI